MRTHCGGGWGGHLRHEAKRKAGTRRKCGAKAVHIKMLLEPLTRLLRTISTSHQITAADICFLLALLNVSAYKSLFLRFIEAQLCSLSQVFESFISKLISQSLHIWSPLKSETHIKMDTFFSSDMKYS